jgi:hypothetical protein
MAGRRVARRDSIEGEQLLAYLRGVVRGGAPASGGTQPRPQAVIFDEPGDRLRRGPGVTHRKDQTGLVVTEQGPDRGKVAAGDRDAVEHRLGRDAAERVEHRRAHDDVAAGVDRSHVGELALDRDPPVAGHHPQPLPGGVEVVVGLAREHEPSERSPVPDGLDDLRE